MESKKARKPSEEEIKITPSPYRLDHFRVYNVVDQAVDHTVGLRGQFDKGAFKKYRLTRIDHFANPVDKNDEGIFDKNAHLTWYVLEDQDPPAPPRKVEVSNQFGHQTLLIEEATLLLAPTHKIEKGLAFPRRLDHFICYRVTEGKAIGGVVTLRDQFILDGTTRLREPLLFCVPVDKRHKGLTEIMHEKDHLTVYRITDREIGRDQRTRDQFDKYSLRMVATAMLAVPSRKLRWSLVG